MNQLLLTPESGPYAGCPNRLEEGVLGRALVGDPTASRAQVKISRHRKGFIAQSVAPHNPIRLRVGYWWPVRKKIFVRHGQRIMFGQTPVRVARRPPDLRFRRPGKQKRSFSKALFLIPMLIMPLLMWRSLTANKWAAIALGAILISALVAAIWQYRATAEKKLPFPTPWGLYLAATGKTQKGKSTGPLMAWLSASQRGGILKVEHGESVYLVGSGAKTSLWWWLAQCDAKITPLDGKYRVSWKDGSATMAAVPHEEDVPASASRILAVDQAVGVSQRWFEAFLETNSQMPALLYAEDALPAYSGNTELWVKPATRVQIGADASGPVYIDLADGPHALVAGTTGAGKSEALTTWLLGLALAMPPWQVNFILVDYKGGAAFAPLAQLPHVAGMLTNLDSGATERALSSLLAELHRRERVAGQGGDIGPRLVIVVDEFRELSLTHPKIMEDLTRIAALGRSLGVSLILATQRPGGVVDSHIRANASLRLCLRVLEAGDSLDVLGDSTAANLPPIPGRAILDAAGNRREVQIAWAKPEMVASAVNKICASTTFRAPAPWAEPLPQSISLAEAAAGGGDGTVLGIADYPKRQCTTTTCLPSIGKTLLCAPTRMGATTTAKTIACQYAAGAVHVFTNRPGEWSGACSILNTASEQALGIRLLLAGNAKGSLVVIDGADSLIANLDLAEGAGSGVDLLEQVCRVDGINLIVTIRPTSAGARWASNFATRIYLGLSEEADSARVGLRSKETSQLTCPGRALVVAGERTIVQVALPEVLVATGIPLVSSLPEPGTVATVGIGWIGPLATPWIPQGERWLIAGSSGSGKTTLARALAEFLKVPAEHVMDGDGPAYNGSATIRILTCSIAELTTSFAGPLHEFAQKAKIVVLQPSPTFRSWAREYNLTGMMPLPGAARPGRGVYLDGCTATVIQATAKGPL